MKKQLNAKLADTQKSLNSQINELQDSVDKLESENVDLTLQNKKMKLKI